MMLAHIGCALGVVTFLVGSASSVAQDALPESKCNARRELLPIRPVAMLQRIAHYSAPLKPNATPSTSDSTQEIPKKATVWVAEVPDGSATVGNATSHETPSMLQLKSTHKVK